jgi:hypothetical protein
MLQINTKKRTRILYSGRSGISPSTNHKYGGSVTPFSACLYSVSHHLVQVPCLQIGHCAGLLSFLPPSPTLFILFPAFISTARYHLWAVLAPTRCPSLPCLTLLSQPPCCPSSPLSPHLSRCCKSKIAIP